MGDVLDEKKPEESESSPDKPDKNLEIPTSGPKVVEPKKEEHPDELSSKRESVENKTEDKRSKLTSNVFYIEAIDKDPPKPEPDTILDNCPVPVPTPRRVNKLRDHNSTIFPVGCMGCREDPPSDQVASPRRFLDPIEARDYVGHIDNTPRKRPSSAKPNNVRNPLTGVGVDDEIKRPSGPSGRRKVDGNPLLGEGYETKQVSPSCTRIPPGGYSQGLW